MHCGGCGWRSAADEISRGRSRNSTVLSARSAFVAMLISWNTTKAKPRLPACAAELVESPQTLDERITAFKILFQNHEEWMNVGLGRIDCLCSRRWQINGFFGTSVDPSRIILG